MLKLFVGKIFGFQRKIEVLEEQIEHLRWDMAFGMWTREAFLQFCQIMPRGMRILAFIDLDQIHVLNEEYGYAEVDRRVKSTFSVPFRRSDIVARWYSGDEIVILFDSDLEWAESKISELQESAQVQELTFHYALGEWEVGKSGIEELVEELSTIHAIFSGSAPPEVIERIIKHQISGRIIVVVLILLESVLSIDQQKRLRHNRKGINEQRVLGG